MAEKTKGDPVNLRKGIKLMRRLWPFIKPSWPQFVLAFVGIAMDAAGNGLRLWALGPFIKVAMDIEAERAPNIDGIGDAMNQFGHIAGALLGAAVLMGFGTLLRQYFTGYVQSRTTINLQRAVLDNVLRQPMTFFNAQRKGALISRLTANTAGAGQLLRVFMEGVISSPATMIALMVVLIIASPQLSLVMFVVLPAVLLPAVVFASRIRKATKTKYKRLEASGNFFLQALDGIRVVKSYRLEEPQREEFKRVSDEVFRRDRKVARYKGLSRFAVEITYNSLMAGGIIVAGMVMQTAWFEDVGGLEVFAMFLAGMILLYDPARKLSHSLNDLQESTSSLEAVFEVYDRKPEIADMTGAKDAPNTFEQIDFDKVQFSYVPGRPVLRDVSFTVKRGQMVAFVGQSGMGKSTLMDLIPRFYDPVAGAIRVDGTDLREYKLDSWLRNIAIVSQETFLFNTTIRQNIMAGKPDATEDEVIAAAKAAHIWEEISAMPNGLDTPLGDRGVNLSGGQRQRVAIARAFLRRAPILLLDEATSSLDTNSEREVQRALEELIQGCTVFAVAHRLSTIRSADQIIVLSHGRVIEHGTHEDLMALGGNYAMAARLQQGQQQDAAQDSAAEANNQTEQEQT